MFSGFAVILFAIVILIGVVLPLAAIIRLTQIPAPNLSLPLIAWVLIIVCFPFLGSIAFFLAGTRYGAAV